MTDCQETNYTYFSDTRETTASLRRQTPDATCFLSPSLLVTRSPCLPPAKRVSSRRRVFNEMCLQHSVPSWIFFLGTCFLELVSWNLELGSFIY